MKRGERPSGENKTPIGTTAMATYVKAQANDNLALVPQLFAVAQHRSTKSATLTIMN